VKRNVRCWVADYQGLEGTALIEEYRKQILCTFRAYTTGLKCDIFTYVYVSLLVVALNKQADLETALH